MLNNFLWIQETGFWFDRQAFPPVLVYMSSYANRLLVVASYSFHIEHRHMRVVSILKSKFEKKKQEACFRKCWTNLLNPQGAARGQWPYCFLFNPYCLDCFVRSVVPYIFFLSLYWYLKVQYIWFLRALALRCFFHEQSFFYVMFYSDRVRLLLGVMGVKCH